MVRCDMGRFLSLNWLVRCSAELQPAAGTSRVALDTAFTRPGPTGAVPWSLSKRPQATPGYLTGGHENQGIHGREAGFGRGRLSGVISELCDPFLRHVYRLDGVLDLGDVTTGHRRVVPLADRRSTALRSMATCCWPAARPGRSSCGRHGAWRSSLRAADRTRRSARRPIKAYWPRQSWVGRAVGAR